MRQRKGKNNETEKIGCYLLLPQKRSEKWPKDRSVCMPFNLAGKMPIMTPLSTPGSDSHVEEHDRAHYTHNYYHYL